MPTEKLYLEILAADKLGKLEPAAPGDGQIRGIRDAVHTRSAAAVLAVMAGKLGVRGALSWMKHKLEKELAEYVSVMTATESASINAKEDPGSTEMGISAKWLRVTREGDDKSIDFLAELDASQRDVLKIIPRRLYWRKRAAKAGTTLGLSIRVRADAIWLERNVGRQAPLFDVCLCTARAEIEDESNVHLVRVGDEPAAGSFFYPKEGAVLVPRPPWSIDETGKAIPNSGRLVVTATVTEVGTGALKSLLTLLQSAVDQGGDPIADGLAEALKAAIDEDEKQK